jgi:predicted O-methyltransferase YrrM
MDTARWDAVDDYFASLLITDEPRAEGDVPAIAVSPLQGRLLELLARLVGARRILELGTLAGYSTLWLARARPETLITLEANPEYAAIARENLAGVAGVELIEGPALESLPRLGPEPFDLIFLDADKRSYPEYLGWALRLSRPGTLLVADNVVRGGAVLDGEDASARGVRRFSELVAAEPRLAATAIQTVGGKGYDGFLLAIVS